LANRNQTFHQDGVSKALDSRGREMFASYKTRSNTRWCWRDRGWIGVKNSRQKYSLPSVLQQTELGALPRSGVQTLDMWSATPFHALAECHGNKKKAAELLASNGQPSTTR